MPFVRAALTGGRHVTLDGRFAPSAKLPKVDLPTDGTRVASLVPAQLVRLLARPDGEAWRAVQGRAARRFGRAAGMPARDRDRRLPVYLTYGMTETAAACAVLPPERLVGRKRSRRARRALPGSASATAGGLLTVATPARSRAGSGPATISRRKAADRGRARSSPPTARCASSAAPTA
jgi:acyl-CoA synthetase (AMP-forming)/AMP-acid ligase II